MTISERGVVDFLTYGNATGLISLIIADHLDWSDALLHMSLLQEKVYRYLDFAGSGEVHTALKTRFNKEAKSDSQILIKVVAAYLLPDDVADFVRKIAEVVEQEGFLFEHSVRLDLVDS